MEPLLIGGIIVSILAAGGVAFGRLKKVKVPRTGTWSKPPRVRYEPGVDLDDLKKAVKWWTDLGHLFGRLEPVLPGAPVEEEIRIRIDPATVDARKPPVVEDAEVKSSGHGVTDTRVSKDGQIQWALVFLYENNSLVLTHELGHAIGFDHPKNPPTGHMMHGKGGAGWDDHRGLEQK